jgi:hypothetical protein
MFVNLVCKVKCPLLKRVLAKRINKTENYASCKKNTTRGARIFTSAMSVSGIQLRQPGAWSFSFSSGVDRLSPDGNFVLSVLADKTYNLS